ncbi:golgi membrane protein [Pochonia chlamydosporia 170]|uniref:Protein CASP n=1 Tax=Pochonia chlamydosporia 170 TaxID=1380566 RepID=A0A179FRQ4_METCM|nr:golgi membrane protein [Pochonia chlamydosporia 170]OAQ68316.1 golgi membrane protein [Pochonia chlamydosporia 170]
MAEVADGVSTPNAHSTAQPDVPTAEGAGNKFQNAISAWRNVDLTTLTAGLDNTASDIVTYQRDSTVQRKELAQKTKDFRKLDDPSKLTEIKGLLKAYQNFIDLLTNHSKSVNSAFLQAYTSISEAPDPYPLLEASVDSMLLSEETLPKLTKENKELQENVSKLTSQLEDSEHELQQERASRKEIEDNLDSRIKDVESSWNAVMEEKKDNWEAKEKSLEEKVEHQERLLNEMRASYEVNQRLGKVGEDSESHHAKATSAELEMLHSDIERTSARLAEVEARNEQLRLELAQAKSSISSQPDKRLEDDPGYMRMRSENSSLIRKLDASRMEKESMKRDLDSQLRTMERETLHLREEKETLKSKVQKWNDYEDIKQELEVLKSIEFSTGDDDEVGEKFEGGADKGDSLEKLLLSRNKKLGDELTVLRVSHNDLQTRLEDLQEELSRTNAELEKSQNLNQKLEEDLENMQAEGANAFPSGASVAGTYVTRAQTRKGRISPTSSIISGLDPRSTAGDREPMGGGSGILPMVTAQRDRFKKKNGELEQELSETHRTVQQLRQEVAALQKDNLNLYEKTRYVSTYNRGGATATSSSAYSSNPNPSTVSIGESGNPGMAMDRYRKAYESNISPFAAFRGRESARAYRRMSLPERVVYSITRMVLASRTSRNLFAAYCVALHVLVFFSLYWLGSADFEKHATSLGSSAAAAGAAAAGAAKGAGRTSHGDWKQDGFNNH